jgi:hypothetical protein
MTNLKHILLTEKVSKREIDMILKDDDLQCGVEFEFIIPAFAEKYADDVKRWETLTRYNTELQEYDDFLEKWEDSLEKDGEDENYPPPTPPEWAQELGYEPGDQIPEPDEEFPELKMNIKKIFTKLVNEFMPLDKLPFTNYKVTHESKYKDKNKWVIKPDGSLGAEGMEVVSPVLSISEFMKICPKMIEFIDKYGKVTDDCGLHIGMSIKGVGNLGEHLDVVKLALFTDEDYIYKYFDTRKYNDYARSAHTEIKSSGINVDKIKDFIKTKKLEAEYSDSHHMAINIENLTTNNPYIEFRYVGGPDYHKKWDRIKNVVAQYGWNLLMACDPDFRKKEYLLKLHNIMLKAEWFSNIVRINELKKSKKIDAYDEKEIKDRIKSIQSIKRTITLTNDDIIAFAAGGGIDLNDIDEFYF